MEISVCMRKISYRTPMCEITFLLAFAYWCNEIKEGISPVVVSDICHPKEKKISGSFNKTVLLFTSSSQSQLFVT